MRLRRTWYSGTRASEALQRLQALARDLRALDARRLAEGRAEGTDCSRAGPPGARAPCSSRIRRRDGDALHVAQQECSAT
jgi:hypothetical protein